MKKIEEVWKDIKGYEGLYQVSNLGRVLSIRNNRILKPYSDKAGKGYYYIHLKRGKNSKIHRLVAQAFLPNPENKDTVNHIDGNTKNNQLNNLEWATHQENCLHRVYVLGQHNGEYKMRRIEMRDITNKSLRIVFPSISQAIRWLKSNTKYKNASTTNISAVCSGKRHYAYGYVWNYLEEKGEIK